MMQAGLRRRIFRWRSRWMRCLWRRWRRRGKTQQAQGSRVVRARRARLNAKRYITLANEVLAQLHRPIRLIQERLPRLILLAPQSQRDQRIALRPLHGTDELHSRLLGRAAALLGVAPEAGADEVFPRFAAAEGARQDVVDREVRGREVLAAVLALVAVAGEEVAAVELHGLGRQLLVAEEADDAGHGDIQPDGLDPVVPLALVLLLERGDFLPGEEVVVVVLAIIDVDDLGQVLGEHDERPACRDDADGHVQLVEDEDLGVEPVTESLDQGAAGS